jgi:hypothetical protein
MTTLVLNILVCVVFHFFNSSILIFAVVNGFRFSLAIDNLMQLMNTAILVFPFFNGVFDFFDVSPGVGLMFAAGAIDPSMPFVRAAVRISIEFDDVVLSVVLPNPVALSILRASWRGRLAFGTGVIASMRRACCSRINGVLDVITGDAGQN